MQPTALNVLQITDTHIAADPQERLGGVNTRESFLAVKRHVLDSNTNYDAIWLTGDLTANSEQRAYEWLFDELGELDVPVYCLPGNHDVAQTMRSLALPRQWQYCGDQRVSGWHIVLLDSTVVGEAYGTISEPEFERLETSLAARPQASAIVVLHHNPIPMRSRWLDTMTLANHTQFWSIIDRYSQVRGVVWGHVHQNYDSFRNGVRLLATPSTCVQFDARARNFAIAPLAPGYRRLSLMSDGKIDSEVFRVRR